jgi:hypothetical protein
VPKGTLITDGSNAEAKEASGILQRELAGAVREAWESTDGITILKLSDVEQESESLIQ